LANRIGRDLFHYHGNFALKYEDKVFREAAEAGEVKEFVAIPEDAILDLVNAGA